MPGNYESSINQPVVAVRSLAFQFDDGEQLFANLNFAIGSGISALIGRNGAGKSCLAGLLAGHRRPASGSIERHGKVACFRQMENPKEDLGALSLSEFLGVKDVVDALERVSIGQYSPDDLDLIGDDWQLPERLQQALAEMGITASLSDSCAHLSGGQLVRLALWRKLQERADLLILDEPTNHLDYEARQWLIGELAIYPGAVLLVGHDRQLLRQAGRFLSLSSSGLQSFHGSYDAFIERQAVQDESLVKRELALQRARKKLKQKQKLDINKAQIRARQGKKLRHCGSQPKVLLDARKESAESAQSGLVKRHRRQQEELGGKLQAVKALREKVPPISMALNDTGRSRSRILVMTDLVLPRGSTSPITRVFGYGDKVHLKGRNGSGKSTLLQVLLGELEPLAGDLLCATTCLYLDQHYSELQPEATVLRNFMRISGCVDEGKARTMLAAVGYRGSRSSLSVGQCSGGEKMRLAMLAIGSQEGQSILLLDEPDNHLDVESKQLLARALADYQGSYLLVSHDDCFARDAGCNADLELLI